MTPAEFVVQQFGGVRALARALDKHPSSISRWSKPKAKGGLDGRVPSTEQVPLLELADERGIDLTPADLVVGRTLTPEPA